MWPNSITVRVLQKTLSYGGRSQEPDSVEKGERRLFDDIRYLFYVTNDRKTIAAELVFFANKRCDQENVIAQLKSGVNAFRIPSDGLESNWAYMVIAALAWNLKAWYGLVTQSRQCGSISCAWSSSGLYRLLFRYPARS